MNNKLLKYAAFGALLLGTSACNDSFLDKAPTTTISEVTAFESYESAQAYMWPCYSLLYNTTIGTSVQEFGLNSMYRSDRHAGYLSNRDNDMNDYAFQELSPASSGNGWDFSWIYHINIMLRGLETSSMPQAEKEHWQAVGYFFHSFWYMELLNRFGDVPWIDHVIDPESEDAYGPRTPRDEVAKNILTRLQWAEQHIGDFTDRDGANSITKACVQLVLSRFTLREGTWRKYHGLGGEQEYLQECVRVSQELMQSYPTLYTGTQSYPAAGYGELWTSPSLAGVPGVILYREYVTGYLTSHFNFRERNDQMTMQLPQDMVDMYLTKNGLPIHNANNTQYKGDSHDIYDVFADRDPRLYQTVTPPYLININGMVLGENGIGAGDITVGDIPEGMDEGNIKWTYISEEQDPENYQKYRQYIDLLGADTYLGNPGQSGWMKRLPVANWSCDNIINKVPNLKGNKAPLSTSSGYYLWKCYNCWEQSNNNAYVGDADKPIFKIEEALLNYAEAACELGQFDQAAADRSINLLRARAGVAPMQVAQIDADFDPNRDKGNNAWWSGNMPDYEVSPLLWEVRRERIIELMGEGFGFYDVRRWAKAPYFVNRQEKGMWWNSADPIYTVNTNGILNEDTHLKDETMTEGYIYVQPDPLVQGKGWEDYYYLYCIPTEELLLNKNLTQNPGWPSASSD